MGWLHPIVIGSDTVEGEEPPNVSARFGIAWPPLITATRTEVTPEPVTCTVSSRIRSTSTLTKSNRSASQSLIVFVPEQSRGDSPGRGIAHGIVSDCVTGPNINVSFVGSQPLQLALLTAACAQLRLPLCGVPNRPNVPLAL